MVISLALASTPLLKPPKCNSCMILILLPPSPPCLVLRLGWTAAVSISSTAVSLGVILSTHSLAWLSRLTLLGAVELR